MRLTTDQQEALLQLQRIQLQQDEIMVARQRQMQRCWDLLIPARRIGMAANTSTEAVIRRFSAASQRV
jgi:hypothetical protein